MSSHPTDFKGSVVDALREAIERQIPNSHAQMSGGGGHFTIEGMSPAFAGKRMLESQRNDVRRHRAPDEGRRGSGPCCRHSEDSDAGYALIRRIQ